MNHDDAVTFLSVFMAYSTTLMVFQKRYRVAVYKHKVAGIINAIVFIVGAMAASNALPAVFAPGDNQTNKLAVDIGQPILTVIGILGGIVWMTFATTPPESDNPAPKENKGIGEGNNGS